MVNGLTHYLREAWKKPSKEMMRDRLIQWRAGERIVKLERPTRLDRAHNLGYKAKKGFLVFRVRVLRGGRRRLRHGVKGRKSRNTTIRKTLKMSYQWVAEIRLARKYRNLEVLNSYNIGKDGKFFYYEVIAVDPQMPEIKSDKELRWIAIGTHKKRAERGLTSAAKKSRGLRSKSHKIKVRPSLRAWHRVGK